MPQLCKYKFKNLCTKKTIENIHTLGGRWFIELKMARGNSFSSSAATRDDVIPINKSEGISVAAC